MTVQGYNFTVKDVPYDTTPKARNRDPATARAKPLAANCAVLRRM